MAQLNMNLGDVDAQSFDLIPPGLYPARVSESEITQSKSGNHMITWSWEIIGEDHTGRKVWDRMMLDGSDTAKRVGQQRLKAMAIACGHPNPNFIADTEELHGRECLIKIKIDKGKDGYDDSNKITAFKPIQAAPAAPQTAAAPAGQAPPPPAAPAKPAMPWEQPANQ